MNKRKNPTKEMKIVYHILRSEIASYVYKSAAIFGINKSSFDVIFHSSPVEHFFMSLFMLFLAFWKVFLDD